MGTSKAIELAIGEGLDLVEISPNTDPPVCKILDYGKYKYESQKRKNEAKKKGNFDDGDGKDEKCDYVDCGDKE